MLLSTFPPQTHPFPNNHQSNYNLTPHFPPTHTTTKHLPCRASATSSAQRPLALPATTTSLRHVSSSACDGDDADGDDSMVSSAAAIAAAIRGASTSPVDFVQRIETRGGAKSKALVLPSHDFQRLCVEQLDLFRRIVDPDALLSVYVRPAGSYVMDQLELRRITSYPAVHAADIVVLVGNFSMPAGLRIAEAAISSQQVEFFPELGAVVFPLVTHPFVVGFLVAEIPTMAIEREWHDIEENAFSEKKFALSQSKDRQSLDVQTYKNHSAEVLKFNKEQKQNAMSITRSIAMAYVMDQKAMLNQQSSWQNNVRMNNLVEQIRDSLSCIQTLSKMLSVHVKRSEVSYDMIEDILVQGDRMRDTLQQLQDAVYLTKANIMRYNNEKLKKTREADVAQAPPMNPKLSSLSAKSSTSEMEESTMPLSSPSKDLEFPMPPLALVPSRREIRKPCLASDVLVDLVDAIKPLAQKQRRTVELCDLSRSLLIAVEETALRQALSNLIEGALLRSETGGRVDIMCTVAPAGGGLIIVDDDGPDMHYMTQTQTLMPFGADLFGENTMEDNLAWNFVAGLTVAREILETYGCVVRVFSPKNSSAAIGAGGTRIELWLPSFSASSTESAEGLVQEA